jgi:hypothetical protein
VLANTLVSTVWGITVVSLVHYYFYQRFAFGHTLLLVAFFDRHGLVNQSD